MTRAPISLNQTKAAEFVGVSRGTLDKWGREGQITAHKMGDGRNAAVLYAVADLYGLVGLGPDGEPIVGDDR